jgi:hypothetical protein
MSESYIEQLQQRLRESEERERRLQAALQRIQDRFPTGSRACEMARAALAQPQAAKRDIVAVDHEGTPVYALSDEEFSRMNRAQPQPGPKHQPHCLMLDPEEPEARCTCGQPQGEQQEHVCGKQGFGRGADGINDRCAKCEQESGNG